MVAEDIIAALQLPEQSRVNQRISKKLLIENLAPTAVDRQQINEGIEEVQWIAALKPANCGVPDYHDAQREYVEIAVLHMILRPDARTGRLAELLHRAVPHPALLVISQRNSIDISLSHKRWAQNEARKIVLDGELADVDAGVNDKRVSEFLAAMAIPQQPRSNLYGLYQGWIDTLQAFQVAQRTGCFHIAESQAAVSARHYLLQTCVELEANIATLRSTARKERQIARQVEVNMQINRLQIELSEAQTKLQTS